MKIKNLFRKTYDVVITVDCNIPKDKNKMIQEYMTRYGRKTSISGVKDSYGSIEVDFFRYRTKTYFWDIVTDLKEQFKDLDFSIGTDEIFMKKR